MAVRGELLGAGRRAAAVLDAAGARRRVEEGYTRVDPFAVAALDGVPVLARPLDRLLGAFLREDQPGIIVNSARPIGLVHMTCAHELGHYYLGHRTTADETIDYGTEAKLQERQADWFAYMLLTPRWLLARLMAHKGWSAASFQDAAIIYQLSLRMGVSFTGAVWSLHRNNVLRLDSARQLAKTPPVQIKRSLAQIDLEDPINQDVWLLDVHDRNLVLEPRENDKFVVQLPSRVSAGYLWSLDEAAHEGFELRPMLVDGSKPMPKPADGYQVGGVKPALFRLERSSAGAPEDARLSFRESQPWRPASSGDPSFGLSARFESITEGLTAESRERLVQEVASE
jgi:IrrE N-terminal-like domain